MRQVGRKSWFRPGPAQQVRGMMVTPTRRTIPAASVVQEHDSRGNGCDRRAVERRDVEPGNGLRHPMAVLEKGTSLWGSCSRERESIRVEARPMEARALQVLSPGPVLPQFSDRVASAMSMQIGQRNEIRAGLHAYTTLQVGSRVKIARRVEDTMGLDCVMSGSTACHSVGLC